MVTYKADVPAAARIVCDYGIKVIEKALTAAGMSAGVITSTLRLPDEQAEIMYRNAKANLTGQYKLYGNSGDQVLTVYKTNKASPKDEVVALMKNDPAIEAKRLVPEILTWFGPANITYPGIAAQ